MTMPQNTVRLAALGDVHCGRHSQGQFKPLFEQISEQADILALCGDLTEFGLPDEAHILVRDLTAGLKIPVVAVFGNHDVHSDKQEEITQILSEAGVNVIDGEAIELLGIGFAGVKGFAGGFVDRALQPWGEAVIKRFVHEALDEALKLESALAKLRTPERVVLLHYSPIKGTVEGEPEEIFPYLGSSRLEEPLLRYPVTVVFHGHAHYGSFEGRTRAQTPVYNVAMPVLRRQFPDRPPFFVMEITKTAAAAV